MTVAGGPAQVEMEVAMGVVAVGVLVRVQTPGAQRSQQDQHAAHASLECLLELWRDAESERDGRDPSGEERQRVTKAPEGSEQTGAGEAPMLAHEGGHRGHVVSVHRVADPEEEPESE